MNATFAPQLSLRKSSNASVVTYRGNGYVYHFHKKASDLLAKLKISRELLAQFTKRCGEVNTTKLPGLYVTEQGGGWYEVFVLNPLLTGNVLQFLQRLNRWVLKQVQPQAARPKSARYVVTAREFPVPHKMAFRATDVHPAEPTMLQNMVAKFNAKYGKR
jgi:hypothetical protein